MSDVSTFLFVDEAGDPGRPYKKDKEGNKIPTGASLFYILSSVCINANDSFLLESKILKIKKKRAPTPGTRFFH